MSKKLLRAALLLGNLGIMMPAMAQNPASQPEAPLPTVMGAVLRPQNASASTMQNVMGPSGGMENLYIHTWDVNYSSSYSGIAWRRTEAGGSLIMEDFFPIKYARDIDAVIYEDAGKYFVLAAYYFDDGDPTMQGHYYDIYYFDPGGLIPVSTMNYLTSSQTFGRINVDGTSYGLAITWCVPGTGIFAKAAALPGAAFGPDVLMPGTATNIDPDICIRRGAGGSGTGLDLQMVFLENTQTVIREYRAPFFNVLAGSPAGFTQEMTGGSPGPKYFPPRIDCPDKWGGGQRWAVAMGANSVSGSTVTEWIYALVKNEDWPGVAPTWTYPTLVNLSYVTYNTTWPESNDAVIAYNREADQITVGWITKQSTSVIPGTNDVKYVSMDVKDDGTAAPTAIPGSFNMISNTIGSFEPVLAFSGQNLNSDFDGLYTAYSQYNTVFPDYSMMYKSRPPGLSTFKGTANIKAQSEKAPLSVGPNPFTNSLSFTVPAEGNYKISLMGINGSVIYTHESALTEGQLYQISTPELATGNYIMQVSCPETKLNYSQKVVKK